MTWYQTGTVTVVNGSTVVDGVGTDFMPPNVFAGEGFVDESGLVYEVTGILSSTRLTISPAYRGAGGADRAYKIMPAQDYQRVLALQASLLVGRYSDIANGVGQGMFAAGTVASPGVRFAVDQDTGLVRTAENRMGIVNGGVLRVIFNADGVIETTSITESALTTVLARGTGGGTWDLRTLNGSNSTANNTLKARLGMYFNGTSYCAGIDFLRGGTGEHGQLVFVTTGAERGRIDIAGNLLVGTALSGATCHYIAKAGAEGTDILAIGSGATGTVFFQNVSQSAFSAARASMFIGRNSATGRSINAGGTLNSGGADYAEYMTKAKGCGPIAKGDVCGVDSDGMLTRTWADAIAWMVKTTDPNLVGGDTWSLHLGPRPTEPAPAPVAPGDAPQPPAAPSETQPEPIRAEGEDDTDYVRRLASWLAESATAAAAVTEYRVQLDAYAEAVVDYTAAVASYPDRAAAHDAEVAAWREAAEAWDSDMETARQCVDRIAYCGQTPVNVDAETLAACEAALADGEAAYLVAVARGGGIGVALVREGAMTLPHYMRRLGKLLAVRDSRPIIDVQHG